MHVTPPAIPSGSLADSSTLRQHLLCPLAGLRAPPARFQAVDDTRRRWRQARQAARPRQGCPAGGGGGCHGEFAARSLRSLPCSGGAGRERLVGSKLAGVWHDQTSVPLLPTATAGRHPGAAAGAAARRCRLPCRGTPPRRCFRFKGAASFYDLRCVLLNGCATQCVLLHPRCHMHGCCLNTRVHLMALLRTRRSPPSGHAFTTRLCWPTQTRCRRPASTQTTSSSCCIKSERACLSAAARRNARRTQRACTGVRLPPCLPRRTSGHMRQPPRPPGTCGSCREARRYAYWSSTLAAATSREPPMVPASRCADAWTSSAWAAAPSLSFPSPGPARACLQLQSPVRYSPAVAGPGRVQPAAGAPAPCRHSSPSRVRHVHAAVEDPLPSGAHLLHRAGRSVRCALPWRTGGHRRRCLCWQPGASGVSGAASQGSAGQVPWPYLPDSPSGRGQWWRRRRQARRARLVPACSQAPQRMPSATWSDMPLAFQRFACPNNCQLTRSRRRLRRAPHNAA